MAEDQSQEQSDNPQPAEARNPLDQRLVVLVRLLEFTKGQVERLNESVTELTSRYQHIDELGDRIGGALSGLESQKQVADEAQSRTSDLLERATSAAEQLAGVQDRLGARIDRLEQDLERALAGIESTSERSERANSKIEEQVFALKGRVTAFAEGVEQWFKPAQGDIEANRAYVELAAEKIGQQLHGFDQTAAELERRVDESLAELRQRHESLETGLQAKLDALHPDRMSELAAERIRPLVDELMAHVSDTCLG